MRLIFYGGELLVILSLTIDWSSRLSIFSSIGTSMKRLIGEVGVEVRQGGIPDAGGGVLVFERLTLRLWR